MSAERAYLLLVRGAISELAPEEQVKVEALAQQIRQVVGENGDIGSLALALVAAETAVAA